MICHMLAFGLGFLMDLVLGDPEWLYHPVRVIGSGITFLERCLLGHYPWKYDSLEHDSLKHHLRGNERNSNEAAPKRLLWQGCLLVLCVLLGTVAVTAVLIVGSYAIHVYLGIVVETILTWQILAIKSLRVESMRVYVCLKKSEKHSQDHAKREDSEEDVLMSARQAVARIVGRDTAQLDEAGVIRAAVETVAENTSDGVIAPMLYLAFGGPILGMAYKAVNTMDSMVGYTNEKYLYFGRAAAKLDDAVNFLPARISAGLMLAVCLVNRTFDFGQALRIYRRDRRKHASPNSAQTEAVCAGALGLRLAGPASYFGKKVDKPYIGDEIRQIEPEDIRRANRLMVGTAWLCEVLCLVVLESVWWMLG
ncbi:MAG: cobalamin biosynthesis protein [Lachnospiraceae bacterium]|nr:cobalamin biosynthesis protein [Lachnospiraceae bacterium]